MTLNFPNSPTTGDQFTGSNNYIYEYDGEKWNFVKLVGGDFSTSAIQDGAVTTVKLADANVTTAKIADANVTTPKLADASVTPAKLSETYRLATAGNILQVVTAETSTEVLVTALSYADSDLSASITPSSASSKILVMVDQQILLSSSTASVFAGIRLQRDSTTIVDPISDSVSGPYNVGIANSGSGGSAAIYDTFSFVFLDSPNTTSSVTYKTQGRPYTSGHSLYFQTASSSTNANSRIVLMEVSA